MGTRIGLLHDPILSLDAFCEVAQDWGFAAICLTAPAIDAYGVIKLRSLLERQGLTVLVVHPGSGEPVGRSALLAGILRGAGSASGDIVAASEVRPITLAPEEVPSPSVLRDAASGDRPVEIRLPRETWRRHALPR